MTSTPTKNRKMKNHRPPSAGVQYELRRGSRANNILRTDLPSIHITLTHTIAKHSKHFYYNSFLEHTETLLSLDDTLRFVCDDVEADSLAERAALTHGDHITFLDLKGRGAMSGNVGVSLLEAAVLRNVVQVILTDDDGTSHFRGNDESFQNAPTDGNISSERALLVYISSLYSRIRSLDSKTNRLDVAHRLLRLTLNRTLASDKNRILLLIRFFVLIALAVFSRYTGHLCQYFVVEMMDKTRR